MLYRETSYILMGFRAIQTRAVFLYHHTRNNIYSYVLIVMEFPAIQTAVVLLLYRDAMNVTPIYFPNPNTLRVPHTVNEVRPLWVPE